MATFNSPSGRTAKWRLAAALFVFFAIANTILANESATNAMFAARAREEYHLAQTRYREDADDSTNAWQFARSCYDAADFATNASERALLADQGIDACRQLIASIPESAPAHYYLAMNLGQLARTEWIGALLLVREMEREFRKSASLDAHFDFAGAERNLGLLYLQAPTVGSIGSRRKAREFLERAVKMAPEYPENHLNLAEAFLKWGEPDHSKTQLNELDTIWSNARTNFTGEAWAESWYDWSIRRAAAEKKLEEISTKPPRESR
jgi:tetratricopeptide (TPR) repeat protein